MSLENNIERIANACEAMLKTMQQTVNPVINVQSQSEPSQPINTELTQQSAEPPAQQTVPVQNTSPIQDVQSLTQYVMTAYQSMGPEKGAQIQTVMSNLGYSNINDVKPEHFTEMYNQIEQLKNA